MARTAASPIAAPDPALEAYTTFAEAGGQVLQQWLQWQCAGLAACCALQDEWARQARLGPGAWPAWMVWHNGAEQLA